MRFQAPAGRWCGLNYDDLQAALSAIGTPVDAAEAHGFLCGGLCSFAGFGVEEWLSELLPEGSAAGAGGTAEALMEFRQGTSRALDAADFGFTLVLPGDEAALADRVSALAAWCGGFLYALGASGAGIPLPLTSDLEEILNDFAEITRAQLDPAEAGEASEAAYSEMFEFVRAGAQLAYDELAQYRASQPVTVPQLH